MKVLIGLVQYLLLLVAILLSTYSIGRINKLERSIREESAVRSFVINKIVDGETPYDKAMVQADTIFFYKNDVLVGRTVFSAKSKNSETEYYY